jgi:hypothetical protein
MPQLETFIFTHIISKTLLFFWIQGILFVYILVPFFELLGTIRVKKRIDKKRPIRNTKPDMSKYLKSLERFNDTF